VSRNNKQKQYIFDIIRKKNVVVTPEELVRQDFIHYLIDELAYPKSKIAVELGLKINDLSKRSDIVVFGSDFNPILAVECKAPNVKIDQKVFDQLARYNLTLGVDYFILTNGKTTYCCKVNAKQKSYLHLDKIPFYIDL